MSSPRRPLALARLAIRLATRVLPGAGNRARYHAEFLAELHDLDRSAQLRYAAGVLSRASALRGALGAGPPPAREESMTLSAQQIPFWRCRVFRWHQWVKRSTEDGDRYLACRRCGVVHGPMSAGFTSTPPWPGDL